MWEPEQEIKKTEERDVRDKCMRTFQATEYSTVWRSQEVYVCSECTRVYS